MGSRSKSKKDYNYHGDTDAIEMKEGMHVLWRNPNIRKNSNKEEYWLSEIQSFGKKLSFICYYYYWTHNFVSCMKLLLFVFICS